MPGWVRKAGLGLIVLAIIGGLLFYRHYDQVLRYQQATNDAVIQADQVAIASKLPGYVRMVAVEDNQSVATGALLAEIDPTDFQTRLAAADAGIAAAQAGRSALDATRGEAQAGVAQARAAMRVAQTGLDHANREIARYRPLVAAGGEPAERLSQLIANRDRAAAEIAAQQAAVVQAERRVASTAAQGGQLSAQVDAARVERIAAVNDLGSTRLTAPIAGRIASRTVRPGQFVQPGLRLMTIVPAQDIYVVANFKETQIGLMRPGQPAAIKVDALPGVIFRGTVASITPGTGANFSLIPPQNATGNFTKVVQRIPVRIRIDAGPAARRALVPGLSLEVEVDTRMGRAELDAIRREQERRIR